MFHIHHIACFPPRLGVHWIVYVQFCNVEDSQIARMIIDDPIHKGINPEDYSELPIGVITAVADRIKEVGDSNPSSFN